MEFEGEEAAEQIGTIYIGKVRNVVKNLNAAFIEYKPGVNGYYSLNDNPIHIFTDGTRSDRMLKSGDELVVQMERAAVKTKDAVLGSELTLTGRYVAVMAREAMLGISAKIKDKGWREDFKRKWDNESVPDCGVIIRTNAYEASFEDVYREAVRLGEQLNKLIRDAAFRTPNSILYRPDSFAVSAVRDVRLHDSLEVITDLSEVYAELQTCGLFDDQKVGLSLRFYEDTYPLSALYNLEGVLDRALHKNIWLRSGGYLVIEPTEAMTVIDVNTGKNIDKKSPEETYLKTNLEAAAEIAAQIRLRNLSGIIIVDFIDMERMENREELMTTLRRYLAQDPVKTTLVDMTALGLVEITRKKVKRPLYESVTKQETGRK